MAIDCSFPYDIEVTVPGTIIISPNHPGDYHSRQDCWITIKFQPGQRVVLQFLKFDIEQDHNSDCTYDYLEIRDRVSSQSNKIGSKLCGTDVPNDIVSTGNVVHILFHTDDGVAKSGFKIKTGVGKKIIYKML